MDNAAELFPLVDTFNETKDIMTAFLNMIKNIDLPILIILKIKKIKNSTIKNPAGR